MQVNTIVMTMLRVEKWAGGWSWWMELVAGDWVMC